MIDMRVQLYVPIIPAAAMDRLRKVVVDEAGGLTEWPAVGHWLDPQDNLITESVHVFEFYVKDTHDNRLWLETVARNYRKDAEQHTVLYVINASETNWITEEE